MTNLTKLNLSETLAGLKNKQFSSVDLTKSYIKNIEKTGVSLTVDNSKRDNVYIKINTNKSTISNLINDNFQLVSHRDGLVNKIDVNFTENKLYAKLTEHKF